MPNSDISGSAQVFSSLKGDCESSDLQLNFGFGDFAVTISPFSYWAGIKTVRLCFSVK